MQNQLLLKKLEMMEEEFMFFNYNIVSAEVLFKGNIQKEAKDIPKSPPSVWFIDCETSYVAISSVVITKYLNDQMGSNSSQ